MPRPVHFEIPAENPERAMQFYSTVFGWKFNKWAGPMDYWVISTGAAGEPGIDGGLMPRRDPNQPCVNTVGIANIDESLKTIEGGGGSLRGAEDGGAGRRLAGLLQGHRRAHLRHHADGSGCRLRAAEAV